MARVTLKVIDRNIALVRTSGNAFNALVQSTIIAVLLHAQATGDCTRALALVNAMPKSTKRGAVINTFADFSPIGMNLSKGNVGFHKEGSKLYKPFDIKGAIANPWFERDEVKKEDLPDTTLEQAHKYVFQLAAKLQKRVDAGEVAANDKDAISATIVDLKAIGSKQYATAKGNAAPRKAA